MGLETVVHASDLVVTNPLSTDSKSQGDDHLRAIKVAIKAMLTASLTKTANYTTVIGDQESLILCDASGGGFTVTLLAAATMLDGHTLTIKKTDSSSNAVIIDGNAAETIDGETTFTLSSQYDCVTLVCDASNLHVVSKVASGVLVLPDGAVGAPALTNTGDLDTGVYFPAADQLGVVVGGSEKVRFGSNPFTGRNLIRNGEMKVFQRSADTFTGLGASSGFSLDGWQHTHSGSPTGRFTITQNAETTLHFANSLMVDVTTADTSLAAGALYYLRTKIEAQDLQHLQFGQADAAQTVLSFWVFSTVTGDYQVMIIAPDGSRAYSDTYNIASGSTWEFKTVVIPGDASGTINDDAGQGFDINFTLAAGSNFTGGTERSWATTANNMYGAGMSNNLFSATTGDWRVTGVQLEVGEVATAFDHRDIAGELSRCERYYWRWNAGEASDSVATGVVYSTTLALSLHVFPTTMRAIPSITQSSTNLWDIRDGGSSHAVTNTGAWTAGKSGCTRQWTTSSVVAGRGILLLADAGEYISFDAEL